MRLFANTLAVIVNGEITQMFRSPGLASREDYYRRIYAKTASMFELATSAGAVLSNSDELTIESLRRFGFEIGMAFQIIDDILDFTGDQVRVGKPIASDLRQGLITLPALYYYETVPDDSRMLAVTEGRVKEKDLDVLITDIRESGAIQQALDEASDYINRGVVELNKLPDNAAQRSLLELSYFIVDREA
jgi:geranylgeranyl pyrophosphate synthase